MIGMTELQIAITMLVLVTVFFTWMLYLQKKDMDYLRKRVRQVEDERYEAELELKRMKSAKIIRDVIAETRPTQPQGYG